MNLPLQLRHRDQASQRPAAWFLSGSDPSRWIEELVRTGLAAPETQLLLIPNSASDRSLAGVLVIPPSTTVIAATPAGLPCQQIAGRLFVPVDAELHPPASDLELRAALPLPTYFFHPVHGLTGFEAESVLRVWECIELPPEQNVGWNLACPGAPSLPELQSVVAALPPGIDQVFGDAAAEIGTEPPGDLPPLPNEPGTNPIKDSGDFIKRQLARLIDSTTRQLPHTSSHRTWINDLEDWANRQLQSRNNPLQTERNNAIHRLLKLFETDPESALRHALPMNTFPHRGSAPPSNQLGTHEPNFNLGKLGGGPADFWDIPYAQQEALRQRYREMADRELQLGRHRRAAYIYAQLLGDLPSAARVLVQGRFYHEAARLYEDHLGNPLEAARCFAEAGLLVEAIERYTKLQRWLEAADLYERLGDHEAAVQNIERAIEEQTTRGDLLRAAELTEQRLQRPDIALKLLLAAWPGSPQAVRCLAAAIELRGRLGRHDEVIEHITRLVRDSVPGDLALPMINALRPLAGTYPHATVRHRLADLCRVRIAAQLRLPNLSATDSGKLTSHLIQLAPHDHLVARDANRHQHQRVEHENTTRRALQKGPERKTPTVFQRIQLPRECKWLHLRRDKNWFYAIGITGTSNVTLVRGTWDGSVQSISWPYETKLFRNTPIIFEPIGGLGHEVALALPGGPAFDPQMLPATDLFFGKPCLVATPSWLTNQHYPIAVGEQLIWTAHVAAGRAVLSCHDTYGTLLRTIDVTDELLKDAQRGENARPHLCSVSDRVALALGNRLVVSATDERITEVELSGQILGLMATLPHTREGVIIVTERGIAQYWFDKTGLVEFDLDTELSNPRLALVPNGPLVLLGASEMIQLDLNSRGSSVITHEPFQGGSIVGLVSTSNAGQFATLSDRGQLTVYQTPR